MGGRLGERLGEPLQREDDDLARPADGERGGEEVHRPLPLVGDRGGPEREVLHQVGQAPGGQVVGLADAEHEAGGDRAGQRRHVQRQAGELPPLDRQRPHAVSTAASGSRPSHVPSAP